jgi:hypothetical protein
MLTVNGAARMSASVLVKAAAPAANPAAAAIESPELRATPPQLRRANFFLAYRLKRSN